MSNFQLFIPIVFIKDYFRVSIDITRMENTVVVNQESIRIICRIKKKNAWPIPRDSDVEDIKWVQASVFLKTAHIATHMSINRLDTQSVECSYNGSYSAIKREMLLLHAAGCNIFFF